MIVPILRGPENECKSAETYKAEMRFLVNTASGAFLKIKGAAFKGSQAEQEHSSFLILCTTHPKNKINPVLTATVFLQSMWTLFVKSFLFL